MVGDLILWVVTSGPFVWCLPAGEVSRHHRHYYYYFAKQRGGLVVGSEHLVASGLNHEEILLDCP